MYEHSTSAIKSLWHIIFLFVSKSLSPLIHLSLFLFLIKYFWKRKIKAKIGTFFPISAFSSKSIEIWFRPNLLSMEITYIIQLKIHCNVIKHIHDAYYIFRFRNYLINNITSLLNTWRLWQLLIAAINKKTKVQSAREIHSCCTMVILVLSPLG